MPIARREPYVTAGDLVRGTIRWRRSGGDPSAPARGLERSLTKLVSADRAVATSSARAGLLALLRSLPPDPRRKIVLSAYTFHGVPWLVDAAGYVPRFVDPALDTARPTAEQLLDAVDDDTRAVIVTHLFGYPGEADELRDLLEARDVLLIEDATHALGASLGGRPVGGLGHAAVFSFGVGKLLPAGGGGALVFDDSAVSEAAVRHALRSHGGQRPWGGHGPRGVMAALAVSRWALPVALVPGRVVPGDALTAALDRMSDEPILPLGHPDGMPEMGGMDGWTASLVAEQLETMPSKIERLRSSAAVLSSSFTGAPEIEVTETVPHSDPVPLYFRIRMPRVRDFRRAALQRGLDTKCDDMCDCGALFGPPDRRYPGADFLVRHSVEIPLSPRFGRAEVDHIARVVIEAARS